MSQTASLKEIASQLRRDVIRMIGAAGSGHPGGSLSSADLFAALYFKVMRHNPSNWTRSSASQDAFILSAGHLAPILYASLARSGYFPVGELATLRQFGTRLQGHPCVGHGLPGIVQASGSLGQGLACAAGIALAKKMDAEPYKVYCLLGDGECEEGEIWESAMFSANHKLDNLIAITDWNMCQIDGNVDEVAGLGDLKAKWEAFGWNVEIVEEGNDPDIVAEALVRAGSMKDKPSMLLMKTEMGHGVDFMAGKHGWHGKAPSAEEVQRALAQIDETLGDY